jgi:hypothetical protein
MGLTFIYSAPAFVMWVAGVALQWVFLHNPRKAPAMKSTVPIIKLMTLLPGSFPLQTRVDLTLSSEVDGLPVEISASVTLRDAMKLTLQEVQTQCLAVIARGATTHEVQTNQ